VTPTRRHHAGTARVVRSTGRHRWRPCGPVRAGPCTRTDHRAAPPTPRGAALAADLLAGRQCRLGTLRASRALLRRVPAGAPAAPLDPPRSEAARSHRPPGAGEDQAAPPAATPREAPVSQAHRCELLTLTDARLAGYRQCGRRGVPSVADGPATGSRARSTGPRSPGSAPPGSQTGCAGPTPRR